MQASKTLRLTHILRDRTEAELQSLQARGSTKATVRPQVASKTRLLLIVRELVHEERVAFSPSGGSANPRPDWTTQGTIDAYCLNAY